MLDRSEVESVTQLSLPPRYATDITANGLRVFKLESLSQTVDVRLEPYRTRGARCRRVIAETTSGEHLVVAFASFPRDYDPSITAIIRAREPLISNGLLSFGQSHYVDAPGAGTTFSNDSVRADVVKAWQTGVCYQGELQDSSGNVIRRGLRNAQRGALHAIAAHWTVFNEPGIVVMPTGTGKTEVMIASAVDNACDRVLVIVPTDPLRAQTAAKFSTYGILQDLGVLSAMPYPVVGVLASAPNSEHVDRLEQCNVVVSTMSSIGRADEAILRRFSGLFDCTYFDEAHHIEAATWKRYSAICSKSQNLLFTATPFREDGKPLHGKIVYNYPLRRSQEDGCFKKIQFVDVFEPDDRLADEAIAEAAVARLRDDLQQGLDHLMLARARTIEDATRLFEDVYRQRYADLQPVLIHSRTRQRSNVLEAIRKKQHRIIVCVDMFGEGFDLPNLKVAALHCVHKSLGITLQFIGRFARTADSVGQATFVSNTAEDGVPESLESLYQEDADWNLLLPDLSYEAIDPQARLSELVSDLQVKQAADSAIEISTLALRPKVSAHVFRTAKFNPKRFRRAFRSSQKIVQAEYSSAKQFLAIIVNQEDKIDWTDSRDILLDIWDLYLAYYDPERQLLFIHSSRKGDAAFRLAKAITTGPVLIEQDEVFKVFSGLRRLTLHSVGLTSRSRNVRYQMFAGLDVRNAIDPVQQQSKLKSNITGVGYQDGNRHGIGCSRKGKIWALRSGSLAEWVAWCDEVGRKLSDKNCTPDDFLKYTMIPELVSRLPTCEALMADWPDQLFESSHFHFEVFADGVSYEFCECQVDLLEWHPGENAFQFQLLAGANVKSVLCLKVVTSESGEDDYQVNLESGDRCEVRSARERLDVAEYFYRNPPIVRLEDGSQLTGNILLKPQEALPETFERSKIKTLDWSGVNIRAESCWKDGQFRPDSVQQRFIEELETSAATFIIDDDDTGESADVIAIEETDDTISVYLWHCKYSEDSTPGRRAADVYIVCGQAEKGVKWTWDFSRLVRHITDRETKKKNGRMTRFIRGTLRDLITLRKKSRRRFVEFHIGIVQPGLRKTVAPNEHLAVLGATNAFIQCVTGHPLSVVASD